MGPWRFPVPQLCGKCVCGKEGFFFHQNTEKNLFCTTSGAARCKKGKLWVTLMLLPHLPVLKPNTCSPGNEHSPAHILPSWLCYREMSKSLESTPAPLFPLFFPRKLSEPVMSMSISGSRSWLQNSSLFLGFAQIQAKGLLCTGMVYSSSRDRNDAV